MTQKERVRPPSKKHTIDPVISVTDRVFNKNLHSMVHMYLKLSGEKRAGKINEFFPPIYKSFKRKLKRTA